MEVPVKQRSKQNGGGDFYGVGPLTLMEGTSSGGKKKKKKESDSQPREDAAADKTSLFLSCTHENGHYVVDLLSRGLQDASA